MTVTVTVTVGRGDQKQRSYIALEHFGLKSLQLEGQTRVRIRLNFNLKPLRPGFRVSVTSHWQQLEVPSPSPGWHPGPGSDDCEPDSHLIFSEWKVELISVTDNAQARLEIMSLSLRPS